MSLRTQFSRLVEDIKRTRETLEEQSPNWANVPTLKLASTLKQYAIDNFKAASSIFDRKVDALENLQKQIDEFRTRVEGGES
ncbi:hypothetical protein [Vibrio coralliilyticus]|uniref:hypothetical protein n=1 Tax=Vibrio coralliilyticus TaxID=190893 RepID=UPI0006CD96EA|nr:hypothetical protein [Vibrio coralliilyticus]AXN34602.1 hypothetical protein DVV14_25220 [Vibrio coralliilyticus]KPH25198.1 hypothetical protein ADU60_17130 [Vibrio coralliilyticus]